MDQNKPLLRLQVSGDLQRKKGRPNPSSPSKYPFGDQKQKFDPKFDRLRSILNREDAELVLRSDPTALAPERLMVFEVKGSVSGFINALNKIEGTLVLIDEDEISEEADGSHPHLYLLVPDFAALKNIESLYRRWSNGEKLKKPFASWGNLFSLLNDIRLWGPKDRLAEVDREMLAHEIGDKADGDPISIEIELVYRDQASLSAQRQEEVEAFVRANSGRIISRCRVPEIHYHGLLISLPVSKIREMINLMPASIVGHEAVMHITPQSMATKITLAEVEERASEEKPLLPKKAPILALIDGVPIAQHAMLADRLVVEDIFGLESDAQVKDRRHGTAMASLIVRGDLNRGDQPLDRKIHVIPVLGKEDEFPSDRLIIDLVYSAITQLCAQENQGAKDILIVNMSLGNRKRLFDQRMSAWARLIDRLSAEFGLLFVVSAGNHANTFAIQDIVTSTEFEELNAKARAVSTLKSVYAEARNRRLLSPAESVNALTIGAANLDNVSDSDRRMAGSRLDPYPGLVIANPSSALGLGFAQSVKPDVLFNGGKEHFYVSKSGGGLSVGVAAPARANGLKVAAPPSGTMENAVSYSGCTSGATALVSRACHQVHDALERTYGEEFLSLPKKYRACLLKALIVHTSSWPEETANLIKKVIAEDKHHAHQKDDVRRFLGFGLADPEIAQACISDRATFWAVGELPPEAAREIEVPIPACIASRAQKHYLRATLAWLTPIAVGRSSYRSVRLKLNEPGKEEIAALGVQASKQQPDQNQGRKGTVYSRTWEGDKAPAFGDNYTHKFRIQREVDQGGVIDDPIPFGIAITLCMSGVQELYEQARARIQPTPKVVAR